MIHTTQPAQADGHTVGSQGDLKANAQTNGLRLPRSSINVSRAQQQCCWPTSHLASSSQSGPTGLVVSSTTMGRGGPGRAVLRSGLSRQASAAGGVPQPHTRRWPSTCTASWAMSCSKCMQGGTGVVNLAAASRHGSVPAGGLPVEGGDLTGRGCLVSGAVRHYTQESRPRAQPRAPPCTPQLSCSRSVCDTAAACSAP